MVSLMDVGPRLGMIRVGWLVSKHVGWPVGKHASWLVVWHRDCWDMQQNLLYVD